MCLIHLFRPILEFSRMEIKYPVAMPVAILKCFLSPLYLAIHSVAGVLAPEAVHWSSTFAQFSFTTLLFRGLPILRSEILDSHALSEAGLKTPSSLNTLPVAIQM